MDGKSLRHSLRRLHKLWMPLGKKLRASNLRIWRDTTLPSTTTQETSNSRPTDAEILPASQPSNPPPPTLPPSTFQLPELPGKSSASSSLLALPQPSNPPTLQPPTLQPPTLPPTLPPSRPPTLPPHLARKSFRNRRKLRRNGIRRTKGSTTTEHLQPIVRNTVGYANTTIREKKVHARFRTTNERYGRHRCGTRNKTTTHYTTSTTSVNIDVKFTTTTG